MKHSNRNYPTRQVDASTNSRCASVRAASPATLGSSHYGFNNSYGSLAGGVGPYNPRYKRGESSVTWHRNGKLIEEKGHVTDLIMWEAVEQTNRTQFNEWRHLDG